MKDFFADSSSLRAVTEVRGKVSGSSFTICLLSSFLCLLTSGRSYGTLPFEQEFEEGKNFHRQVVSSLTGRELSQEDLEVNLGNRAYWETMREKFIQVYPVPGKFKKITRLLDKSNQHLRKSSQLQSNFPYPHFYLALNFCLGANTDQAEISYLHLKQLEQKQGVRIEEQKFPKLRFVIDLHRGFMTQLAKEEERRNFDKKIAGGLAVLVTLFARDLVMYGIGEMGYHLLDPGWNFLFRTCIEARHNLVPYANFIEPAFVFHVSSCFFEMLLDLTTRQYQFERAPK